MADRPPPTDGADLATDQIATLRRLNADLQRDIADLRGVNTDLENTNRELTIDNNKLQADLSNSEHVNAKLQTELDHVKQELGRAQKGTLCVVELFAQRERAAAPTGHRLKAETDNKTLQAALLEALKTNSRMEQRIATFLNSNTSLEQRQEWRQAAELRKWRRADTDNLVSGDDVFQPAKGIKGTKGFGGEVRPFGGFRAQGNRDGETWGNSGWANTGEQEKESGKIHIGIEREGSVDHWDLPEKKTGWDSDPSTPKPFKSCGSKAGASENDGGWGDLEQDEPRGTRIEGSHGNVFYVSTPPTGKPSRWDSLPGNANDAGLASTWKSNRKSNKPRFAYYEYTRLLGLATWIEEKDEEGLLRYWDDYAKKNQNHAADEWRAYYEAQVRPVYLSRLGHEERKAAAIAKSRDDSVFAWVVGNDMQDNQVQASADRKTSTIENLQAINNDSIQESDLIDLKGGYKQQPFGATADRDFGAGSHSRGFMRSKASIEGTIKPDAGSEYAQVGEVQDSSAKHASSGASGSLDNDTSHRSELVQMGTAHPVHFRSYSKDDVKEHDFAARNRSSGSFSRVLDPMKYPLPPDPSEYPPIKRLGWQYMVSGLSDVLSPGGLGLRRTVSISNVPVGTMLADIIDILHGGKVISVKLIKTADMKTTPPMEGNTAMVEFFGHSNATRFRNTCVNEGLRFLTADGAQQEANVALIPTPTPFVPEHLTRGIHDCDLTRIVYIRDPRGVMTVQHLMGKYFYAWDIGDRSSHPANYPLRHTDKDLTGNKGRAIRLEFATVEDARKVHRFLYFDREFSGMTIGFSNDPITYRRKGLY
ncbi:hypothetical protein Q7P37_002567 [Cladosporium fusiforme]